MAAAEGLVYFLLDNMLSLLKEEANLLRGMRSDVKELKDCLMSMEAFLKDAEGKEVGAALKDRVKQVQDLTYEVDDVLDKFILQVPQQSNRHKFTEPLRRPVRRVKHWLTLHEFPPQIKEMKDSIHSLIHLDNIRIFPGLQPGSSSTVRKDPRVSYPVIKDTQIMGLKKPMEELFRVLYDGELSCSWISVVGAGGLGKTTLVKKVYASPKVKRDFICHALIDMSQSLNPKELLQRLLKELFREWSELLPGEIHSMETDALIEEVRNFLQPKRYVVVFDDLWCIDLWESIKRALPDNNQGSRVMLITRSHDIASKCDHVYNLRPLPNKEAWNLFCKTAFRSPDEGFCPPELKGLSEKIVEICEGLPLAIVSIGDFLSKRDKTLREWEKLHNGLGYELESNPSLSVIPAALLLSYNNLPFHLKPCFLYFSVFPQAYKVKRTRLIRLWIAEGFVQRKEGKTLEEIADDYLNKLISGNLVEVAGRDFDGPPRTCRVHNIMHKIILLKSKEENFSTVYAEQNMDSQLDKIRRLSIPHNCKNINGNMSFPNTRALFIFDSSRSRLPSGFSSLKVLDLQDTPIENFPDAPLPRLRYLSLRNTNIRGLPKSLGNSRNLETLDLKQTYVSVLPTEILRLQYLRHLLVCGKDVENSIHFNCVQGLKLPTGIQHLSSLQKLSFVKPEGGRRIIRELENLVGLRKLGVTELKRGDSKYLCLCIQKMKNLHTFDVTSTNTEEVLDLDLNGHEKFKPPPSLQRLYLKGRLEKVPHWISQLSHLVRIGLKWSRLRTTPLRAIQDLPSLMELQLVDAYTGQELVFEAGGFQKLKILELDQFHQLNTVTVQNHTMPGLQKLTIRRCENMKMVPVGIIYLNQLKELQLYEMPEEFVTTLKKNEGEDHLMVGHIQIIRSSFLRSDGSWSAPIL